MKGEYISIETLRIMQDLEKENKELHNEIEKIKIELQDTKEHLGEYLHEQEEENERLNNIIDELEKYIEGQKDKYLKNKEYWTAEVHNYILNKLQELKGDVSNEKDTNE